MKIYISISVLIISIISCKVDFPLIDKNSPNIVLIVADDLGYTDLGCFGSEIGTPHLDSLASHGQVFTQFYTAATCSPTRAMLLSGVDNHIAGLGDMAEHVYDNPQLEGQPGYEGYLNENVLSFPKLLKDKGYHTYISGKWHLGLTPEQTPNRHGFEKSFSLLDAYSNHFVPDAEYNYFWEDDNYVRYPDGQYSTNLYTDKAIGFIGENRRDERPFFLLASYTAPHWPLQAPAEYIAKYEGNYDMGYDSLRILRMEGLKLKGIVDSNAALPLLPKVKGNLYEISDDPLVPWIALDEEQRKIESRKMEIYAGMVSNLDDNIGRLIAYLKDIGEYDNTLFVFISDNGAAILEANDFPPEVDIYENMGSYNSFVAYGPQWAHASSAVNKHYKGYISEGGIHSPMIVKMPYQSQGKGYLKDFVTVKDIAPTFLELAGCTYPTTYKRRQISPLQGESFLKFLQNQKGEIHPEDYVMGWELFGRGAVRKGSWKLTKIEPPFGNGGFELYNLSVDPSESNDLSEIFPDKYQEMITHWEEYVSSNGVIITNR